MEDQQQDVNQTGEPVTVEPVEDTVDDRVVSMEAGEDKTVTIVEVKSKKGVKGKKGKKKGRKSPPTGKMCFIYSLRYKEFIIE